MSVPTQLALTERCRHCGVPVPPFEEVAPFPHDILVALDRMKLALPDVVKVKLTVLAAVLPHYAGTCARSEAV